MKTCKKCGLAKPLSTFSPRKDAKDGLAYWCMSCKTAATTTGARRKAVIDAYRKRNRDVCIQRTLFFQHRKHADTLDELDEFVLKEAIALTRLRKQLTGGDWWIDHVVPVTRGGTTNAFNLQVAPARWNQSKGNRNADRFFGA